MQDNLKKISRVSLLLIAVSLVLTVCNGFQVMSVSREIKVINTFLQNAEAVQPDYEKSIVLYTTKTEKVFEHLMELRPASEEDYVTFISAVEGIGKVLSLDLNVKSMSGDGPKENENGPKTLSYRISFYGTRDDLMDIMTSLRDLPYFIRFDSVNYRDLANLSAEEKKEPNNSILIGLYVK